MARIVFVWELGGGFGHIHSDMPLAKKLQDSGHEVLCFMKHVINADKVLGEYNIKVLQAPVWQVKPLRTIDTYNYAEILFNQGYLAIHELTSMARTWDNLFDLVNPDLLIVDHAPTALLGARGKHIKTVLFGTGFYAPPRQSPMPGIIPWARTPAGALEKSENKAVEAINTALQGLTKPLINSLSDLFDVDENFLATFEELDHYSNREPVKYWGPVINQPGEYFPDWPAENHAKKIFCYLKTSYPEFSSIIKALQVTGANSIVYAQGATSAQVKELQASNVKIVDQPVDIHRACQESDLVLCHAGHGTTSVALLKGRPMLLFPEREQLEQVLVSRRVVMAGAGRMIGIGHEEMKSIAQVIENMLQDLGCTEAAVRFAQKYADFDPHQQLEDMAARCEELLAAE